MSSSLCIRERGTGRERETERERDHWVYARAMYVLKSEFMYSRYFIINLLNELFIWEKLYKKKLICVHRSHLVPDKHPLTSIFAAFFLSTNCLKSSWVENGDYYSLSRVYLGPNVKVSTHLTLYRRDYRIVLIHSTCFLMSDLVSNVPWSFFISPFPLLSFSSLSKGEKWVSG